MIALASKFLEMRKVKPTSNNQVGAIDRLKDPPKLLVQLSNDAMKKPNGPQLSEDIIYKTPPKTLTVAELGNQDFGCTADIPFENIRDFSMGQDRQFIPPLLPPSQAIYPFQQPIPGLPSFQTQGLLPPPFQHTGQHPLQTWIWEKCDSHLPASH